MRALHVCLITAALVLASVGAQAERFTAVVATVVDGDTVWVRPDRGGAPRPVRIEGIDAPEICQAFGVQSRNALKALVHRRRVVVISSRHDSNRRLLARLHRDGQDVGETMVVRGYAWSYRFRGHPGPYAQQERRARHARAGLWAHKDAMVPRDFRVRNGSCYQR
ncbi:MAG: thermonuclease family protein [Ramlibacter sp.]|nr:thermonuclease family protein [Ramlibacter sp.]